MVGFCLHQIHLEQIEFNYSLLYLYRNCSLELKCRLWFDVFFAAVKLASLFDGLVFWQANTTSMAADRVFIVVWVSRLGIVFTSLGKAFEQNDDHGNDQKSEN